MNLRKSTLTALLTMSATLIFTFSLTAQCDSGGCDSGGFASSAVASTCGGGCGLAGGSGCGFGYPGSNCCNGSGGRGFGIGHHNGPLKQHYQHLSAIHQRDFARNQAWPRPFDCADRQIYHEMWNAMLNNGSRWNCMFTAGHFDPDTNQLNEAGMSKVRAIFRNSSMSQKFALVQNEGNSSVVDSRLQNLQATIDKWYGSDSFVQIALAGEFPTQFSGARAENIATMAGEQTPPPIIPVATGTGSTSDVGVGQ